MKFYELTPQERRDLLEREGSLTRSDSRALRLSPQLKELAADGLIENQVGIMGIPIGLLKGLVVNGEEFNVPMATEEPSVVAGANAGAKIANMNGGVKAAIWCLRIIPADIVFQKVSEEKQEGYEKLIRSHHSDIIAVMKSTLPTLTRHNGGIESMDFYSIDHGRFWKVRLNIWTGEAMGANIANTLSEAVAKYIGGLIGQKALASVLSNGEKELAAAAVEIDPKTLATKSEDGLSIARKIVALSKWSQLDDTRAVTHNKGIMNGVVACALATGNDTRAMEAAAHWHASSRGKYKPLSTWYFKKKVTPRVLKGKLMMPMPIGRVGFSISTLGTAEVCQRVLGCEDLWAMQKVFAAVGLVQNLAALRSLAGDGITQGHLKTRSRNLARAAGARGSDLEALAEIMMSYPKKTVRQAETLLTRMQQSRIGQGEK